MREINSEESDLIIDRLVEYNLSKVLAKQEDLFILINRVIENENEEIIAKMY